MAGLLRAMLDNNAFDELSLPDAARDLVEAAVDAGRLELVVTHVVIEEVNAHPDPDKRRLLQRVTVVATHTAGWILGTSVLDAAALPTDEEVSILNDVILGNPKHVNDALILTTARREQIPVVTSDKRLRGQCAKHGVATMYAADLLASLR